MVDLKYNDMKIFLIRVLSVSGPDKFDVPKCLFLI